jgi:hypothetical protein
VEEPASAATPGFAEWLGSQNVEELLTIFHGRVQNSYEQAAAIQKRPNAVFFIERGAPYTAAQALLPELYPGAREIILVRDFRDMVASMLAYNEQRGFQFFGRNSVVSDEEYIAAYGRAAVRLLQAANERSDTSYLLKYEDLIRRPEETLKAVLAYLGLSAEPDVIDRMLRDAESVASTDQDLHRTSTDAEASIGRWRRDLEPSLQAACEDAFGETLASLGY